MSLTQEGCCNVAPKLTINVVGDQLMQNSKSLEELLCKVNTLHRTLCPASGDKECGETEPCKEPNSLLEKLNITATGHRKMINKIDTIISNIMEIYL